MRSRSWATDRSIARRLAYLEAAELLEEERETAAPGGSPATALPVATAAVIEAKVAALPCPRCGGSHRLLEHTRPRPGLREVAVVCRQCGTARSWWFSLGSRLN